MKTGEIIKATLTVVATLVVLAFVVMLIANVIYLGT